MFDGQRKVRILQARYPSARHFQQALYVGEQAAIYYSTKTELTTGEMVLLEILFPGLPQRVLLRGRVATLAEHSEDVLIEVADEDVQALAYLRRAASGRERPGGPARIRRGDRIPLELRVTWIDEAGESREGNADDVSAGGMQIRTDTPARLGSQVAVTFSLGDPEPIQIGARVAWTRDDDTFCGMGVQFSPHDADQRKRVRELIRRFLAAGKVESTE